MKKTSTEEIEELLAELLLSEERESCQERFLSYLVMEPFIRQFRAQGMSNIDILELCRRLDERKEDA